MKTRPESSSFYFPPEECKDKTERKIDPNRLKRGILAHFFSYAI